MMVPAEYFFLSSQRKKARETGGETISPAFERGKKRGKVKLLLFPAVQSSEYALDQAYTLCGTVRYIRVAPALQPISSPAPLPQHDQSLVGKFACLPHPLKS